MLSTVNAVQFFSNKFHNGIFVVVHRLYLIIILTCLHSIADAQALLPADTANEAYCAAVSKTYVADNKLFNELLKEQAENKKISKYYTSSYETIFEVLNDRIKKGHILYIPAICNTLEKILQEIRSKNESVPADIKILLTRETQPNAYTFGDNYIFVNLGLFYHMENEAQVASVISHEIGHILLRHALKSMVMSYESNKVYAADVKLLKSTEIHAATRALEILKNAAYNNGKVSRERELEADSIGYLLYKNTGYPDYEYLAALHIVEKYENVKPDSLTMEAYKRFFDLPEQKFNDSWLKQEDFSSYNYNTYKPALDKDSASSHPKCAERIQHLQTIYPQLKENGKSIAATSTFTELKNLARSRHLPNLFFNEDYGEYIYTLLVRLQADPDNKQYRDLLGKGFYKIYEARKAYLLNRYVERVKPHEQTKSYMQFLSFIWNLKIEEMEKIAEHYSKT